MKRRPSRRLRVLFEMLPHVLGGSEIFTCNLIAHLDPERYEPRIVASREGKSLDLASSSGIPVELVDYQEAKRGPLAARNLLKDRRIDLVQSGYYGMSLALAARAAGIAHVWRLGGHVEVVNELHPLGGAPRHVLALVCCLADTVVCPSGFVKEPFDELGLGNVRVIRNGVDCALIRRLGALAAPAWFAPGGDPRIAMVAHFLPQKRHIDLIRAAAQVMRIFPGARFYFVGGRGSNREDSEFVAALGEEIRKKGLESAVVIRECGEERFALLARMDLLVLPSLREGASNAVLEAMALGLPVVATRSGGNPELMIEGSTGVLVPPEDPRALAEAIVALLTDETRRKRMGEAGKRRVEQCFGMRACASAYDRLFQQVIQARASRAAA